MYKRQGQRNTAVGFFDEMHVNKITIPYKEHFQALIFTDGVAEAIDDDENKALAHLEEIGKYQWTDHEAMAPLNVILPEEKQANQHDDMCVVLVRG